MVARILNSSHSIYRLRSERNNTDKESCGGMKYEVPTIISQLDYLTSTHRFQWPLQITQIHHVSITTMAMVDAAEDSILLLSTHRKS
jgi:hypothetical protein